MKLTDLPGAVKVLSEGELVIYPTETLYGLGADIHNPQSVERIFQVKGRNPSKPVSILVASTEQVKSLVQEISPLAQSLMDRFFPGPLTLVLPASESVDPGLHGETGWIGIRQSSHPMAQELVSTFGNPITTTSANPSEAGSGISEKQIIKYFESEQGLSFLPGGDLPPSQGSTVVKVEGDDLKLLRPGEIDFKDLRKLI